MLGSGFFAQDWLRAGLQYGSSALGTMGNYIVQNTIGDSYAAYRNPEEFISELHRRSWESGTNVGIGHIGPYWQSWLPKFVYVSGSDNASFRSIAEYGEHELYPDPAARSPFKVVERILGMQVINTMQGKEPMQEKAKLKAHLNSAGSLNEVYEHSLKILSQLIEEHQQQTEEERESFPVLVNHLIFNILGHCVFGINTELDKKYIPEFMEMARLITNPWPSQQALQAANLRLRAISEELLQGTSSSIDENGYVADHAELSHYPDEEEKMEKLSAENIAGSFLASTNLADLMMKTIAAISENREIKTKLMTDLLEHWTGDLQSLSAIPYLDLIYLEAQRLFSPSLIARRNSKAFILNTRNEQGEPQQHLVPAHSYLFAPIRPRHLDPNLWDMPQLFDPERFAGEEGQKREKLLVTFSDGMRSCPAKFGFTKMLFKTIIAGFFSRVGEIQFEKPVEITPVFSINTSWQEDNRADFIMRSSP